jgi:chromosome segregation ATPase
VTVPSADLLEIKTALAELRGQIAVLAEAMSSGDRESGAGMNLLAQAVEGITRMQSELRNDHKEAISKFEARTEAIRKETDTKVTGLRMAMEAEMREHQDEHSPHSASLGVRVSYLETSMNKVVGGLILAGSLGVSGLIALIRGITGG